MTIENKSEFLSIQTDVCEVTKKEEKEPDKICPTCKPDESFVPPQWWSIDKPFLNKKTCEYSIGVTINQHGDTYSVSSLGDFVEKEGFEALQRTYVRPAIRQMLRYYDKLESDEIICGLPPENPGEECGDIIDVNYRNYIKEFSTPHTMGSKTIFHSVQIPDGTPPTVTGRAANMDALEVYAQTPEFRFSTIGSSGTLQVLVTLPAFIFDKVPETPDLPEVDTATEKISMKAEEFYIAVRETTSALRVFSNFQSYFYQTENGNLYFKEDNSPFFLKFAANRLNDFLRSFESLIEANGMRFGDGVSFLPKADEIEITFDKSDENKPFVVKRVRAKEKNCKWKKMKKGFSSFLKRGPVKDQTTMSYISNIKSMHMRVKARETPPWIDFTVEFTYPQLGIDFGSAGKFPGLDTCLQDTNAISNLVLNSVLSFSEAFAYQLNKANCLTMYGKEYALKNFPIDYSEQNIDNELEKKGMKEKLYQFTKNYGFDVDEFENLGPAEKSKYIKYHIRKKYKEEKRTIKNESPLLSALHDFKMAFERDKNYFGPLGTLVGMFNPCSFKDFSLTILKCLFRGMDAKTAYMTVIKGTLGNMAAEGLEIVIQALPADKQEEIRTKVEKEFKSLPAPWDKSWHSGSLRESREANAVREIETKLNHKKGIGPLKDSIKETFSRLHRLGFVGELKAGIGTSDSSLNYLLVYTPPTLTVFAGGDENSISEGAFYERTGDDLPTPPPQSGEVIENVKILTDMIGAEITEFINDIDNHVNSVLSGYIIEKRNIEMKRASELIEFAQTTSLKYEMERDEIVNFQRDGFDEQQIVDLLNLESTVEERLNRIDEIILESDFKIETQTAIIEEWKNDSSNPNKSLFKDAKKEAVSLLRKLKEINEESLSLSKSTEETKQFDNWDNLSDEDKNKVLEEQSEKQRFSTLNPDDDYRKGTLGKALGNTQQAITKAYVDSIIETAEIQEIMRALDNVPGIKMLGGLIASFKCPNTHFIYPSIDSFLDTLSFDPCGLEPTDLRLPSIQQIPNLSWDFIDNIVKAFIKALKITLKEALAALMVKTIQLLDASICKLLGGEVPETLSLMDFLGREGCKESDILKAAGAAPPGRPPLPEEEYANLANTLSNAGSGTDMQNALLGNCDSAYANNIVNSVSAKNPAFADVLSSPDAVCEFFTMASGLMTEEQRSTMEERMDSSPILSSLTNKCLTDDELEERNNNVSNALSQLPSEILNKYNEQEQDRLNSNADQVIDLVLNGPANTLNNILDSALGDEDPDCTDKVDTVGAVMKKARETESFKNVRTGIFNRVQKAFLDDTIDWNLFEGPFDSPGILGQILADTKGYTLNRYNWYRNLQSSNPVFAFLFPEPSPLPQTVGLHIREKFLSTEKQWNGDRSPNLVINYDTEGIDDDPWYSSISLYNDFNSDTLDSKLQINTLEYDDFDIVIKEPVTEQNKKLISKLSNDITETGGSYRGRLMGAMIKNVWSEFSNVSLPGFSFNNMVNNMNQIISKNLSNSLFYDSRGQTPQGFLYGYEPLEITADDLTYVNPEPGSMEYTYDESSQVLGRSLTNNPRVQFLDPVEHGGSYSSPFYNILAEEKQGWSRFAQTIVSNLKGCEDADSNFMFFQDIMDKIQKEEGQIPADERLQLAPDCVNELPFDKIGSPTTLATLGGVVTSIIRTHVVDYMLRTFTINANVDLTIGKNHSKLISKFIVKILKDSLSEQASIFTSTYERGTYWLLFLEQAVQSVQRKIENGELEAEGDLGALMDSINAAQKRHKTPSFSDLKLIKDLKEFSFIGEDEGLGLLGTIVTGALVAGAGLGAPFIAAGAGVFSVAFGSLNLNQARLSAKLGTIYSVQDECMEVLEYLVEEQVNFYSDVLLRTIEPRPYINDISKFFLGSSGIMIKGDIRAGEVEIEQPTGGGDSNFPYGSIDDCVSSILHSPLDNIEFTPAQEQEIKNNGGFFLEKYLRVKDKKITPRNISEQKVHIKRDFVDNRSDNLKGVVNIQSFKQFLSDNESEISADVNISDLFGDARTILTDEGYSGTIGIKFGVRLCYIPPDSFVNPLPGNVQNNSNTSVPPSGIANSYNPAPQNLSSKPSLTGPNYQNSLNEGFEDNVQRGKSIVDNLSIAVREKSFILKQDERFMGSKSIFPLCFFEKDIPDNKLVSYIDSDENFNQELKCYVDGLAETAEFKLLFDHIINIKKIPSMVSIYSYLNFYASLGKGAGEREDAEDTKMPDLSDIFNDTKNELRKLFVANYKRKDFDPPNEEDSEGGFVENITRDLLSKSLNNIFISASVPWWAKWKYKRKRVDEDGEVCKNQFGGLINLTSGD